MATSTWASKAVVASPLSMMAYDIQWPGLSLEEKRDGYCLLCIAKPLYDFVIQRA